MIGTLIACILCAFAGAVLLALSLARLIEALKNNTAVLKECINVTIQLTCWVLTTGIAIFEVYRATM